MTKIKDRQLPERGYRHIEARRSKPWQGEEEVRAAWVGALELECDQLLDLERARKDSSFNNVIIEFKAPGLFNGSKSSAAFRNATQERLLPYIKREAARTGLETGNFIGICIDGEHVCFGRVEGDDILMEHLLPFNLRSLEIVVEAIRGAYRRASAAAARDALVRLFGGPRGHLPTGHVVVRAAPMRCVSLGTGRGERTAASCTLPDGHDLSCAMVRTGTVLRWRRYGGDRLCRGAPHGRLPEHRQGRFDPEHRTEGDLHHR